MFFIVIELGVSSNYEIRQSIPFKLFIDMFSNYQYKTLPITIYNVKICYKSVARLLNANLQIANSRYMNQLHFSWFLADRNVVIYDICYHRNVCTCLTKRVIEKCFSEGRVKPFNSRSFKIDFPTRNQGNHKKPRCSLMNYCIEVVFIPVHFVNIHV